MIYDDLGGGKYRIILKVYRDCAGNGSPFDGDPNSTFVGPALITVFDAANNEIGVFDIGAPVITPVPPAFNNPCIFAPNNICIQQGVYTYTATLPPIPGGYVVVYQRCCRNSGIVNLVNSDHQGSTYFAKIPGPEMAAPNSSPRFTNFPPIYICRNVNFVFNHAATDPDASDQLVYSLCAPFQGLDGCCASIGGNPPQNPTPSCPSPPSGCPNAATFPPYSNVIMASPYSGSYPMASNPAFSINPTTGQLSGTPTMLGSWVVGVCVQEFRNNVLIDTHFRDFQFTVINCSVTTLASVPVADYTKCLGLTVSFGNNSTTSSPIPLFYHWDFGVPSLTNDTSNLATPTYVFPDTGIYVVTLIANPGKQCSDTIKLPVYAYEKFEIDVPSVATQCLKNNSFNFMLTATNIASTTFTWNFTPVATPSISNLQNPVNIVYTQPGVHTYTAVAKYRVCRDTIIDSLRVIPRPKAKINNLPTTLCDPATVAFSNGSSSELPITYLWQFSTGATSTLYEPTQVFSPSGVYSVSLTVTTSSVCIDTNMVSINNVTVNPSPYAGFSFSPQITTIFDPEITINNTASPDAVSWNYAFGDGATSGFPFEKHVYETYGDYTITQYVTNNFGCSNTISQVVKILPEYRFWVPNAFTPDESTLNDVFLPIVIGAEEYIFEIYDRWGEKIFKTNDTKKGWNGTFKGQPCKQDIYVWRITFLNVVSQKDEVHYGHVTLMTNL